MTIPSFQGELLLAGWRDTHNGGATVTFWLPDPADLDIFRGMTVRKGNQAGQRFMAVLVEIGADDKPVAAPQPDAVVATVETPAAAPNKLAEWMHTSGYFRNPKLWLALDAAGIYTQEQHKRYIEGMACVGWGALTCSGDVCLHHVKTAANSGVGHKPEHYYGVPLCHNHHRNWAHGTGSLCATRNDKQDLLERAVAITAENVKAVIKKHIGIESLKELTLATLNNFEESIGLQPTRLHERDA